MREAGKEKFGVHDVMYDGIHKPVLLLCIHGLMHNTFCRLQCMKYIRYGQYVHHTCFSVHIAYCAMRTYA